MLKFYLEAEKKSSNRMDPFLPIYVGRKARDVRARSNNPPFRILMPFRAMRLTDVDASLTLRISVGTRPIDIAKVLEGRL